MEDEKEFVVMFTLISSIIIVVAVIFNIIPVPFLNNNHQQTQTVKGLVMDFNETELLTNASGYWSLSSVYIITLNNTSEYCSVPSSSTFGLTGYNNILVPQLAGHFVKIVYKKQSTMYGLPGPLIDNMQIISDRGVSD